MQDRHSETRSGGAITKGDTMTNEQRRAKVMAAYVREVRRAIAQGDADWAEIVTIFAAHLAPLRFKM